MSYRPPKPKPLNIIRKTPAADEDELDDEADKIQELEDEAVKVAAKALREMNTSSEMDMYVESSAKDVGNMYVESSAKDVDHAGEEEEEGFEKQTAEDMDFIDDEPVHNQASYRDFPEEESNQPIILKGIPLISKREAAGIVSKKKSKEPKEIEVGSEIEDDFKASVGPKLFALTTSLKTKMLDLVAKKAMEDENQIEASNETVVIDDVHIPNDQVPEPIQWIEVTDAKSAFDLVKERMKYFVTQDDMLSRGADLIRNRKYLNALRMVVTINSYITHRKDRFGYEETEHIVVEQAGSQQIIKDSTTRSVLNKANDMCWREATRYSWAKIIVYDDIIKSKQRNVILDHVCEEVSAYKYGALEYGVTQDEAGLPQLSQDEDGLPQLSQDEDGLPQLSQDEDGLSQLSPINKAQDPSMEDEDFDFDFVSPIKKGQDSSPIRKTSSSKSVVKKKDPKIAPKRKVSNIDKWRGLINEELGLSFTPTKGDGHCLFRAVLKEPRDGLEAIKELRFKVAEYLKTLENGPFYLESVNEELETEYEDWESYCDDIKSMKTVLWGSEYELAAIAQVLDSSVVVLQCQEELTPSIENLVVYEYLPSTYTQKESV
ncbi:hypothetical protein HDV02_004529, partial [Globomyces sp. JEL0801]